MVLNQEIKDKLNGPLAKLLIKKIKTLYDYRLKDERMFYCEILDKLIKDQYINWPLEVLRQKRFNKANYKQRREVNSL